MSRRNRHRNHGIAPAAGSAPADSGIVPASIADAAAIERSAASDALAAEVAAGPLLDAALPLAPAGRPPATEAFADAVMRPEQSPPVTLVAACQRLLQHDSVAWWCACGATGRVGRSNDGIPFVNEEILRHAPGERR